MFYKITVELKYYFSGDELYLEDSYFVENVMFTEKRTKELMKEGKKFH